MRKANRTAIGTLVKRSTGYAMFVSLPDGYKPEHVTFALAAKIQTLPKALRRTLTWDQGPEMRDWKQIRVDAGIDVFFCAHTHPGNAVPTRTPTACCGRTSPMSWRSLRPKRSLCGSFVTIGDRIYCLPCRRSRVRVPSAALREAPLARRRRAGPDRPARRDRARAMWKRPVSPATVRYSRIGYRPAPVLRNARATRAPADARLCRSIDEVNHDRRVCTTYWAASSRSPRSSTISMPSYRIPRKLSRRRTRRGGLAHQ
jgi:hypothetical protein